MKENFECADFIQINPREHYIIHIHGDNHKKIPRTPGKQGVIAYECQEIILIQLLYSRKLTKCLVAHIGAFARMAFFDATI